MLTSSRFGPTRVEKFRRNGKLKAKYKYTDSESKPYAEFVFRYRSWRKLFCCPIQARRLLTTSRRSSCRTNRSRLIVPFARGSYHAHHHDDYDGSTRCIRLLQWRRRTARGRPAGYCRGVWAWRTDRRSAKCAGSSIGLGSRMFGDAAMRFMILTSSRLFSRKRAEEEE
jgi:hypothetical protein